ncbi:STAS/SEC14 domain-containing protein [Paracoccus marinaquae]|uniref:STAS/SEC14 domain-containing protein n=1 Tax=Paracoccus marinaquae TaxID=2841926 RepID=A0ABS6AI93_9RHOB|nr:STAS/SEC14 domain-containing protein [Paracoccus marinaquae]MBU3030317.1 STAS/SEC14 domain-containing protein [Paracoccus marinaquae]
MLNIQADADRNVITARPEGQIPASEFEALGAAIEDHANRHDRMPGLVVHLKGLPHWQGLSAMRAHFEVVRRHGMVLPRVAIVTDTFGLAMLPSLADIFVRARVRHFDVRQMDEAIVWAGSPDKEPEGYLLLEDFPDDVIAIRAVGEVTARDYEDRLIPLVRKMAARHGKVRLLLQLGPDFENYTAGAMWDDARLGLTHWRSFERVAVVSDIGWITRSVKMFAPLMPAEVAVFPNEAMAAARAWISENAVADAPVKAGKAAAAKAEEAAPKPAVKADVAPPSEPVPAQPAVKVVPPVDRAVAPVTQPAAEPAPEVVPEPAAKPAASGTTRRAVKTEAVAAAAPAKPAAKTAAKPAAGRTAKTAAKPAVKPAAKPEETGAKKPATRRAAATRTAAGKTAPAAEGAAAPAKPARKPATRKPATRTRVTTPRTPDA